MNSIGDRTMDRTLETSRHEHYASLRNALRKLGEENRIGLSSSTCSKLSRELANSMILIAKDLRIKPEDLAQALLARWQDHRKNMVN